MPMPPMPMGGMMGGMPPMGGLPPGGGMGEPPMPGTDNMAFDAMQSLNPKSVNPTQSLASVKKALESAYELVLLCIPQVSHWNPGLAKELHSIEKSLMSAKISLTEDQPVGPPPDMMLGMQGGGLGADPSMGMMGGM